ncbi:MAG: diguanylate cyclase [Candidatus Aminicenantes bacterium]|nr:diguanylate cyclase [Candidatus Aminicenantes bacterium]
MTQKRILIINPSSSEGERLARLARKFGPASGETAEGKAWREIAGETVAVAVMDAGAVLADPPGTRIEPSTAVLLTAADPDLLERAAGGFPPGVFVDGALTSPEDPREESFARALGRAWDHARLKAEAAALKRSLRQQEAKVQDVCAEIQEIKGLLNTRFLREIEKRIAIESKYVGSQKERLRVEAVLRKIYGADDVSSLLDVVPDIRDIVQAASATVYIVEENETLGRYLKPLVWDSSFLSHSEFSKYVAPLDAQDFAASVARFGHDVNIPVLGFDRRLSRRYQEFLRSPLKSLLGVPVMHDRTVIGVVEVYNKTVAARPGPDGFTPEDQRILRGLCEHMAIAMTKLNLIQYDALTGLLRPEPFFEKVLQRVNALGKRRREEGFMALVMGDVDWFKNYNDRNGHEAGNKLLRELAGILKISIREEDLLCRYGGEEFLFFLTGVKNRDESAQLTERIRKNVEDFYFEFQEFQPGNNLTMSFGVTVFPRTSSDHALSKTDLKRLAGEADLALAEAKGKRRADLRPTGAGPVTKNRVCSYLGDKPDENRKPSRPPAPDRSFREKRRYERTPASTVLMFRENGGFRIAKTVNISLGGVRIVSETRLPPAKTLDTILVLEDKANLIRSDVIYSEKAEGETPLYYSGLRFREMGDSEIRGLEDYLSHFQKRSLPLS